MTDRKAAHFLWRTTAAASGGAVLAIALAAAMPLNLPPDNAAATPTTLPSGVKNEATDGIASLSDWAKVWSIDLGHDVVASAPPPSGDLAPLVQTPPPDLHVIGTILEPGHSLAMLIGPDGKTIFLGVGDQVQGAKIAAIAIDSVTVDIGGKPSVLPVEKPPAPQTPPKPAVITTPEDQ